jgi:hypothetical protein
MCIKRKEEEILIDRVSDGRLMTGEKILLVSDMMVVVVVVESSSCT